MRIIVEQSIEWQSSLYINFIDFEKAFDSISREVLWRLLRHYAYACQGGYYHQSSLGQLFCTGVTQWTEDPTIEYED